MANEDKATRYHRLQRRASVLATLAGALLLVVLIVTGASAALRSAVTTKIDFLPLSVTAYVVAVFFCYELVQLPFAYYQGVVLEQRYGLSTERPGHWWMNQGKAAALGVLLATLGALIVIPLIRWSPDWWWVTATGVLIIGILLLAQLAPVLLMPMFYEFKPLDRPDLVRRLVAMVERTGARVLGVFEWRLGDRTRKANAALAGIGRTRRILVSDTLLAEHSDEEIEVILAHELAHHVHHDIWSGLAVEAALIVAGFFAADVLLAALWVPLGLTGKDDLAALPLLLLVGGGLSVLVMPLFNAFSRAHERRADRYALDLTRNAPAFVSAMKRLGVQNLAEERPSPIVELLFHSHPSISARVAAAHEWAARARP